MDSAYNFRMDLFRAKDFFDLSLCEHAAVFEEEEAVWTALKRVSLYLDRLLLGRIDGEVDKNAYLIDPHRISIGEGTVVEPGAYIRGPCVIGKNCQIRHGAYIRGNFICGNDCVIGHATEIKNTIFLEGSHAGHFAYIGDSILGNRVNLGAGTKCANLRLDGLSVPILVGDKRLDSGLRKLGAILGDDVQLGCNVVTNPGVLMGKKSHVYPCIAVTGFIPEGKTVRLSTNKMGAQW